MEPKKFTLTTKQGRNRWLALFLILIFVGCFFARLIDSDFVSIKIEEFKIDARGATINGEMYYPRGTSSDDCLPCVICMHGTGCTYGVVKHFAQEAARRGFVGIAVSCYSGGLSEQPLYDELGHGKDINVGAFRYGNTTSGMLDVVNYARSLTFVDPTRIGVSGHSMGARISQETAMADAGYYTYNDLMINVLYDTFGQTFTEDEINEDADKLAEERLSPEELEYYKYIAAEKREYIDTRVKAAFPIGNSGNLIAELQTVTVGGYEVVRGCNVNLGILNGEYDYGGAALTKADITKEYFHTGGVDVENFKWYEVDDVNNTCKIIGDWETLSITNSNELAEAIANRSARVVLQSKETHSKNFFSIQTTARFLQFFEQTMNYNKGPLSSGGGMAERDQIWYIARVFNCIALFALIGFAIVMLAIILKAKFFEPCVAPAPQSKAKFTKTKYWIFSALTIVVGFIAAYRGNLQKIRIPNNSYFQAATTTLQVMNFIIWITILSLVLLIAQLIINKKETGEFGFGVLNLKLGFVNVLKSILLAFLLICTSYVVLLICEYLFREDFRFWMSILTELKVDYWWVVFKYALFFFIPYLVIGAAVNFGVRNDIPEWKDTLLCVFFNSAGVWLLCLISYLIARFTNSTALFSNFICSYQLCFFVPITVYLSRKMYKLTNSIWVGATFNALLVAWATIAENGTHTTYVGQNWLSVFFNI